MASPDQPEAGKADQASSADDSRSDASANSMLYYIVFKAYQFPYSLTESRSSVLIVARADSKQEIDAHWSWIREQLLPQIAEYRDFRKNKALASELYLHLISIFKAKALHDRDQQQYNQSQRRLSALKSTTDPEACPKPEGSPALEKRRAFVPPRSSSLDGCPGMYVALSEESAACPSENGPALPTFLSVPVLPSSDRDTPALTSVRSGIEFFKHFPNLPSDAKLHGMSSSPCGLRKLEYSCP